MQEKVSAWTSSLPSVEEIPHETLAQVVRADRIGEPVDAFQIKEVHVPVHAGTIDAVFGQVYSFEEIGRAHQEMGDGEDVLGNRTPLAGTPRAGLGCM